MSISIVGILIGLFLFLFTDTLAGQIAGGVIMSVALVVHFVHDWQQKDQIAKMQQQIDDLENAVFCPVEIGVCSDDETDADESKFDESIGEQSEPSENKKE